MFGLDVPFFLNSWNFRLRYCQGNLNLCQGKSKGILLSPICGNPDTVMHPYGADIMANSVDPDQRSSLIRVYTVCPGLSVRKLRIITVIVMAKTQFRQ